jgi:hypothetical protein
VQREEHASGHNDALTRRAKLALIDETCRALKRKGELVKMCWQKHLREAATSTLVLRGEDRQALDEMEQQVKALLGSVDQALRDFQQEVARLEAQEGCAATCTAIGDTTSRMFCAPAVQSTPWVGRAAKWRRLLAKSIGNTAVVASYLYYVNEVANVMYPLHRDSPLNQTGMPQPDALPGHAPYPLIESGEMAAYAMHGFVLIGAWCTRSVLNTATELGALSVVPGLGLRLGTTATAIWKWARSAQAVAPAGDGGGAAPAPTGTADEDEDGDAGSSSSTSSSSSTVGAADDGNGASPSPTHITTINGLIEPSEDDEDDEDEVDEDGEQDGASTPGALQAAIRDVGQAVQDTRLILNVVRMPSDTDTDTDTVSGSDD